MSNNIAKKKAANKNGRLRRSNGKTEIQCIELNGNC